MKKILSAALAILLVSLGLYLGAQQLDSSSGGSASSKKDLIIYNWGDYIDPDLITKFEKQMATMSSMRLLTQTKPCILRSSRAGQPMI